MMVSGLSFAACCLALLSRAAGEGSKPTTFDLFQDELSQETTEALSTIKKRPTQIREFSDRNFWFYNFTIGSGKVKSVADTGSFDVVVLRKKYYEPSGKSKDLGRRFQIGFATTHPDGTGTLSLNGELYRDIVGVPSLKVQNQEIGIVTKRRPAGKKGHLPANPQAIIGLSKSSTQYGDSSRGWFGSLCRQKLINQCRFGLAFGINQKGKQILGGINTSLFKGDLTKVPLVNGQEWTIRGDVVVNGDTFDRNIAMITDSGTTTIVGPRDDIRTIFKTLGIKPIETKASLRGTYPCGKDLSFGFRLPASGLLGNGGKVFNVLKHGMALQNLGNGTCIAALEAISAFNAKGQWLVGQAFFQGLYVDHNADDGTMGFAHLKSLTQ